MLEKTDPNYCEFCENYCFDCDPANFIAVACTVEIPNFFQVLRFPTFTAIFIGSKLNYGEIVLECDKAGILENPFEAKEIDRYLATNNLLTPVN